MQRVILQILVLYDRLHSLDTVRRRQIRSLVHRAAAILLHKQLWYCDRATPVATRKPQKACEFVPCIIVYMNALYVIVKIALRDELLAISQTTFDNSDEEDDDSDDAENDGSDKEEAEETMDGEEDLCGSDDEAAVVRRLKALEDADEDDAKRPNKRRRNAFLDEEAELSGSDHGSDDDEVRCACRYITA